jgi:hypothetical protein
VVEKYLRVKIVNPAAGFRHATKTKSQEKRVELFELEPFSVGENAKGVVV